MYTYELQESSERLWEKKQDIFMMYFKSGFIY